jgi:hypothetical protein
VCGTLDEKGISITTLKRSSEMFHAAIPRELGKLNDELPEVATTPECFDRFSPRNASACSAALHGTPKPSIRSTHASFAFNP